MSAHSDGPGRGSTFVIELPLTERPAAAWMLAKELELLGHVVARAHDGEAALELAATFGPEIALLDYGQERDRGCSRAAGFEAHLAKPVDIAQLQRLLAAR